jgi:hypothetical protein
MSVISAMNMCVLLRKLLVEDQPCCLLWLRVAGCVVNFVLFAGWTPFEGFRNGSFHRSSKACAGVCACSPMPPRDRKSGPIPVALARGLAIYRQWQGRGSACSARRRGYFRPIRVPDVRAYGQRCNPAGRMPETKCCSGIFMIRSRPTCSCQPGKSGKVHETMAVVA